MTDIKFSWTDVIYQFFKYQTVLAQNRLTKHSNNNKTQSLVAFESKDNLRIYPRIRVGCALKYG